MNSFLLVTKIAYTYIYRENTISEKQTKTKNKYENQNKKTLTQYKAIIAKCAMQLIILSLKQISK